jgi:hypothetical protein
MAKWACLKASSLPVALLGAAALLLSACGESNDGTNPAAGGGGGSGGSATAGAAGMGGVASAPTWHKDIAPIMAQHCQGCHRDGGVGPFSLQTYEQTRMWSGSLPGIVEEGYMPPFLAESTPDCQPRFPFKEDLRVGADKVELLRLWDLAGSPEGDPNTAAPLPPSPMLELTDAEVSVTIPAPITVEGFGDTFICFSLAPDLTPLAATGPEAALLGDRVLLDAVQVHPGNGLIVHHVLVYTDPDAESAELANDQGYYDCFGGSGVSGGSLLLAWAPGGIPIQAPAGVAMAIPSTGRLVMQVHYHALGQPQTDSATSLQLRKYSAGVPKYIATMALMGNSRGATANGMGLQAGPGDGAEPEFRIPAGAENHVETMRLAIPQSSPELRIWAVGTHMHYVGTDMRIGITRAAPGSEPAEECLLQTPDWDFNWQRGYLYDVPIEQAPSARPGDIVDLRCTYDNSLNNSFVVEALEQQGMMTPQDVLLGESTLEEMCLGVFGIAEDVSDLLQ